MVNWTFDLGIAGSKYNTPITWTPKRTTATTATTTVPQTVTLAAFYPNATELGANYADFIGGIKVKLIAGAVLSGAVDVPLTSDGFQPAAEGPSQSSTTSDGVRSAPVDSTPRPTGSKWHSAVAVVVGRQARRESGPTVRVST